MIKLIIKGEVFVLRAVVDSSVDLNCTQERLIPTKYYKKDTRIIN